MLQSLTLVIPTKVGTQKLWYEAQYLSTYAVVLGPDFRRDD
jgi:hypothetical protein